MRLLSGIEFFPVWKDQFESRLLTDNSEGRKPEDPWFHFHGVGSRKDDGDKMSSRAISVLTAEALQPYIKDIVPLGLLVATPAPDPYHAYGSQRSAETRCRGLAG